MRRESEAPPPLGTFGVLELERLGTIGIAWTDRGVTAVEFRPWPATVALAEVPRELAEPLLAYGRGEPIDPRTLPIEFDRGTSFQLEVWNALRTIPRGEVRTYQSIAQQIGAPRATRAVGGANGKNPIPIVVPCHRVVEHGLKLGGFSAGLANKVKLLELEGVRVANDRVQPGQLGLL